MSAENKTSERKSATSKKMLSFALGALIFQTIANYLTLSWSPLLLLLFGT
jgi:hypothetical protein